MKNDFRNFAVNHLGMSSTTLDSYAKAMDRSGIMSVTPTDDYMNPYILEERQLNVTQMDVFSRLMMDRIIFLGTQVTDQSANIIQAQLLYLDSVDPDKDISLYINSPGGSVYAGLGIYDTMQYINSDVSTICTGMAASMAAVLRRRRARQAIRPAPLARQRSISRWEVSRVRHQISKSLPARFSN